MVATTLTASVQGAARTGAVLALLLAAACSPGAPGGTGQFVAQNGLRVVSYGNGPFEVVARPGTVGRDYFCAAADYALRFRGARGADRVVVERPDGPSRANPGGRSATFSVAPAGSVRPSRGIVIRADRAGLNHTVAHARTLCRPAGMGGGSNPNTL